MRTLVVNADDFGFTRDVNAGIVQAHRDGIVTATTLMANGAAFGDAVRLAGENPKLDIGVHLQMVQGDSLSCPGQPLPKSIGELLWRVGTWDVRSELRAQVEKVLAAGLRPTHLDTHKHTHLLPPVLEAVGSLSQEYKIAFVRRPFDLPMQAGVNARVLRGGMKLMTGRFARVLAKYGARSTDHFAGFVLTGRFTAVDLVDLWASLPDGSTEFMCHPGILGEELRCAATRLKDSREMELQALIDPRVRRALEAGSIRLSGYRDL